MSKWARLAIVTALLLGISVFSASAAGPPGQGWWTSFAIQNVGSSAGTLVVSAYQGSDGTAGSVFQTVNLTIPDGGALSYHPGFGADLAQGRFDFSTSLPSGFIGAAVASSDTPIVASAELGNNSQGTVGVAGGLAKAQYQGIGGSDVGSVIRFPVVKHNFAGQTTTFYIQAAGQDVTVDVAFKMDNNQTYNRTYTIASNYMAAVFPADAGVPAGQASGGGSFGAATMTARDGRDIAGVVVEHQHSTSPATIALSTRGFMPSDLGTTLYAPVIKHAFSSDATTGLTVQNATDASITITATFKVYNVLAGSSASVGQVFTQKFTNVPAGQQRTFRGLNTNTLGGMPAGTLASAVIQGSGNVVATVNEANSKGKAVYSCFNSTKATPTVALPQVKELFNGMTNGVIVQNVDSQATTIRVAYAAGASVYTLQYNLAVGEAKSFYEVSNAARGYTPAAGSSLPHANTKYAVTVTSQDGRDIVAIAQEADVNAADGTLDLKNYEGFN